MKQNITVKSYISIGRFGFNLSGQKQNARGAFTILELLAVIMVVSILAGVTVPILQGRVDSAKWSEANTAAGTVRTAVSAYVARYDVYYAQQSLVGRYLDDAETQAALGFIASDLTSVYFAPRDYKIAAIDTYGHATIEVTASKDNAPLGAKILAADGSWQ